MRKYVFIAVGGILAAAILFFFFGPKPNLVGKVGAWVYEVSQTKPEGQIFTLEEKPDVPLYLSFNYVDEQLYSRVFFINYVEIVDQDTLVELALNPGLVSLAVQTKTGLRGIKISPLNDPGRLQIATDFLPTWIELIDDAQNSPSQNFQIRVSFGKYKRFYNFPVAGFSEAQALSSCFLMTSE